MGSKDDPSGPARMVGLGSRWMSHVLLTAFLAGISPAVFGSAEESHCGPSARAIAMRVSLERETSLEFIVSAESTKPGRF